MSLFKAWKKQKLVISDVDPTYKVKYLGNVQTAMMKGEGCVDKTTAVLWNNFVKNGQTVGLDMTLTICGSGLKAITKEQGLTEYRAHRISYCIAHPKYPKLFVWVYRHEGKKMKVELRCHAVLCKTDTKSKMMAVQLHEKLSSALNEFQRDKTRRQNTRLALQRTKSCPTSGTGMSGVPLRNKFLSTAQNFKPPVEKSSGAPKLGDISEDLEEEDEDEDEEEGLGELVEDEDDLEEIPDVGTVEVIMKMHPSLTSLETDHSENGSTSSGSLATSGGDTELTNGIFDLEIGNDIEQLKQDLQNQPDDSDAESSESGFSEQGDNKDVGTSGLTANGSCAAEHSSKNGLMSTNISNNNNLTSAKPGKIKSASSGQSTLNSTREIDSEIHVTPL